MRLELRDDGSVDEATETLLPEELQAVEIDSRAIRHPRPSGPVDLRSRQTGRRHGHPGGDEPRLEQLTPIGLRGSFGQPSSRESDRA